MGKALLLTGRPGVGKTTLIHRALKQLAVSAGGFYTQEIRAQGRRLGFKIITLDGHEGVLAHVSIKKEPRISKYGVDLATLERVGVASLRRAMEEDSLVVVDEIGPMEILSPAFRDTVVAALDHQVPVLGTIVQRSMPFSDAIKRRADARVIEITPRNRDDILGEIVAGLGGLLPRG
jgi:nucleoside-triphosphatase